MKRPSNIILAGLLAVFVGCWIGLETTPEKFRWYWTAGQMLLPLGYGGMLLAESIARRSGNEANAGTCPTCGRPLSAPPNPETSGQGNLTGAGLQSTPSIIQRPRSIPLWLDVPLLIIAALAITAGAFALMFYANPDPIWLVLAAVLILMLGRSRKTRSRTAPLK